MAEGIKIRELPSTVMVEGTDVLVIDTVSEDDPTLTETKQIRYEDLVSQLELDLEIPDGTSQVDILDPIIMPQKDEVHVFLVTVGERTEASRFYGMGNNTKSYYIDGLEAPYMILSPGRTYRFEMDDETKTNYPISIFGFRGKFPDVFNDGELKPFVEKGDGYVDYKVVDEHRNVWYDVITPSGSDTEDYRYMGNGILNPDGDDDFDDVNSPWPMIEALQLSIGTINNSIADFSEAIANINNSILANSNQITNVDIESDQNDEDHVNMIEQNTNLIEQNYNSVVESINSLKAQLELADQQLNQKIEDTKQELSGTDSDMQDQIDELGNVLEV